MKSNPTPGLRPASATRHSRLRLNTHLTPGAAAIRTAALSAAPARLAPWLLASALLLPALGALPTPAFAQATPAATSTQPYAIPAGPLGAALATFAAQAGVVLSFDATLTQGLSTAGLNGAYSVEDGLNALLQGSGLETVRQGPRAYGLRVRPGAPVATLGAVTVRGQQDGPAPALPGGQIASGAQLGMLGNQDIMDVPFTQMAYTAQFMEDNQTNTIAQVLQADPSVRFTTSAGHVYEHFAIRGQSVSAGDIAFNGLYGIAPDGHVATEFLERVEVLRGPSALLSGMAPGGGVGGVINISPKRATDAPVTTLTLDAVSRSNLGAHIDVGRRLGPDGRLGIRFNGVYRDGRTGVDGQSKTRKLAALALDWRGDTQRVALDAFFNEEDADNGSSMMVGLGTIKTVVPPPSNRTNILRGIYANQRSDGVLLRAEQDLGEHWQAYAAIGSAHSKYHGFLTSTRGILINTAGDFRGQTFHWRGGRTTTSGEAGLKGSLRTGTVQHQLALNLAHVSVSARDQVASSAVYLSNIYDPTTPILAPRPDAPRKTADTRLSSLGLADNLSFADGALDVLLGLRLQQVRQRSWNRATGVQTADYDETAVTPALGVVVKPWGPGLSLYASFVEGLSQGGTVTDAAASNYGEVFKPFRSRQLEAGVKWEHAGLLQTLSVYQLTRPTQIREADGPNSYRFTDGGQQRSRGVEWNVAGQLHDDWRLLGGVAYSRVQLTHTTDGALDGNTRFGSPDWSANLGVEWDLPAVPGLTVHGRVVYTDRQFVDDANTFSLPSWTRFDAGLRYETRWAGQDVTLRAVVENVANRSYWEGSFADGMVTLNAPRTFKLSATLRF